MRLGPPSLSLPSHTVTERTRHTGPSTMFFDHEHYEEHLLPVWARNPEFAHCHNISVSVSPCTPSVTLGYISLHPACPELPVPSVSNSAFSGSCLVFCPRNYGPRSRCQGRNSKPCRRTPLSVDGVPIPQPPVPDSPLDLPQPSTPLVPCPGPLFLTCPSPLSPTRPSPLLPYYPSFCAGPVQLLGR